MDDAQLREFFYATMNLYSIRRVFHVLSQDVDLEKIFTTKPAALYCTMYTNMCFYVFQARIKNEGDIRKRDEAELFLKFRLVAREDCFKNITVEDLPRPPPKPVSKKRTKIAQITPLSASNAQFRVFGPPPTVTFTQQSANNQGFLQQTDISQGLAHHSHEHMDQNGLPRTPYDNYNNIDSSLTNLNYYNKPGDQGIHNTQAAQSDGFNGDRPY